MTAIFILFTSLQALGEIEVAFIEVRTYDGQILQLEENGRFAHVAIRVQDGWLHAHPLFGTVITKSLSEIGTIKEILTADWEEELTPVEIKKVLGLPYDNEFIWEDERSSYCSKLVAKFLAVEPTPMTFKGPYWEKFGPHESEGRPGVSPDGLYRALLKSGYRSTTADEFL